MFHFIVILAEMTFETLMTVLTQHQKQGHKIILPFKTQPRQPVSVINSYPQFEAIRF